MRVLIFSFAFFALSSVLHAQEYQNFLTGDLSFSLQSEEANDFNNSFFRFRPGYGKQLNPGWAVGANLNLLFNQSTFQGTTVQAGSRRFQNDLRIWARRSFNPDDQLIIFLEPSVEVGMGQSNQLNFDGDWERDGNAQVSAGLGASVGLLYHLSPRFRLVSRLGGVGLNRRFSNGSSSGAATFFGVNFGLRSVSFGGEYLW